MKSRFALLAMVVVAAAPLAAQGGGGGGGGGGRRGGGGGMNIDNMATMYGLDATTKEKAQALLTSWQTASAPTQAFNRSQQQNGATQNADSVKKVADLRAQFNKDFRALLTADMAKKFDSVTAQQAAGGGGRRGGGGK